MRPTAHTAGPTPAALSPQRRPRPSHRRSGARGQQAAVARAAEDMWLPTTPAVKRGLRRARAEGLRGGSASRAMARARGPIQRNGAAEAKGTSGTRGPVPAGKYFQCFFSQRTGPWSAHPKVRSAGSQ